MTNIDMTVELTPILVCVLTGVLGWMGLLIKRLISRTVEREQAAEQERSEQREAMDTLKEGMRSLLRSELVSLHREWVEEKGYINLEGKEYAERTYTAYHRLGGNGTGTRLWLDIDALSVREERS